MEVLMNTNLIASKAPILCQELVGRRGKAFTLQKKPYPISPICKQAVEQDQDGKPYFALPLARNKSS